MMSRIHVVCLVVITSHLTTLVTCILFIENILQIGKHTRLLRRSFLTSQIYKQFVLDMYGGHIDTISEDEKFYYLIKNEITSFREYGDINRFINDIKIPYHEVAITIAHAYAGLDHFSPFAEEEQKLKKSKFHSDKTIDLKDFIRSKYTEGDMNLLEGIKPMEAFMTNFGIRFEILKSGELYCHVLDI